MTPDQLQNRLQALAALDSARLTEIVRQAQASPSFEIGSWDAGWGDDEGESGVLAEEMAVFLIGSLVKPVGDGGDCRKHSIMTTRGNKVNRAF